MTDKPASPFAGLDKALLRSTQAKPVEQAPPIEVVPTTPAPTPPAVKPRRQAVKADGPQRAERRTTPSAPDTADAVDAIDTIQQALKAVGKEIYYIRVTPEEKARVEDIIYAVKRQGVKTSVNEIGRIALNYLLADYEALGERSFLGRVLANKRA